MKTLGDSFMFLEKILSMKYKKNHKQNCKRHKKLYNTGDMRWKEKRQSNTGTIFTQEGDLGEWRQLGNRA